MSGVGGGLAADTESPTFAGEDIRRRVPDIWRCCDLGEHRFANLWLNVSTWLSIFLVGFICLAIASAIGLHIEKEVNKESCEESE